MPNWCYSNLYVNGPDAEVRAFRAALPAEVDLPEDRPRRKEPARPRVLKKTIRPNTPPEPLFSFAKLVPMPKKLERRSDAVVFNWRVENWGCRWNPRFVVIDRQSKRRVRYHLMTHWSPPIPFVEKVSAQFPRLRFGLHFEVEGDDIGVTRLWFRAGRRVDAAGKKLPKARYWGWC